MAYKIKIDTDASLDLIEYIEWYNKAQAGLGFKFYRQVQIVLKAVQNNPFAFPVRYQSSHTALIKKFPFMVHFFVDNTYRVVVVTSILHTSRDPKIWEERSKKQ